MQQINNGDPSGLFRLLLWLRARRSIVDLESKFIFRTKLEHSDPVFHGSRNRNRTPAACGPIAGEIHFMRASSTSLGGFITTLRRPNSCATCCVSLHLPLGDPIADPIRTQLSLSEPTWNRRIQFSQARNRNRTPAACGPIAGEIHFMCACLHLTWRSYQHSWRSYHHS
jgi:hypothetical protein